MIPQEWLQYAPKPTELTKNNKWHVFLSYRSVNRTWVLSLYDILTELGHKVFIDQCELKAGDELTFRLEQALKYSQAGILIWSNATEDSAWVRKEYNTLVRKSTTDESFKFIPVRLDNAELPDFAANLIYLDFSSYPDGPNGGELLRLLYAIADKPLSNEAAHFADHQSQLAVNFSNQITAAKNNKNPKKLLQLFNDGGLPWQTTAALGCKTTEALTRLDKNEEAITVLKELMKRFEYAIRPKQLLALAYARRGKEDDLEAAQDILGELYAQGERDPETVGIYGRTWMDRYKISGDTSDLRQSRNYYAEAFNKAPDDYYTGINAAAKSVFLGELEKADDYAKKVEAIVGTNAVAGDYWKTATVAEVLLMQKKYTEAAAMYQQAVDTAPTETGSHKSSWLQAKHLMEKLQPAEEEYKPIADVFKHVQE